jgi:hypothetical protein
MKSSQNDGYNPQLFLSFGPRVRSSLAFLFRAPRRQPSTFHLSGSSSPFRTQEKLGKGGGKATKIRKKMLKGRQNVSRSILHRRAFRSASDLLEKLAKDEPPLSQFSATQIL